VIIDVNKKVRQNEDINHFNVLLQYHAKSSKYSYPRTRQGLETVDSKPVAQQEVAALRRIKRKSYLWRTRRKLRLKLFEKAEARRTFVSRYLHVKPKEVSDFLEEHARWGELTLPTRHWLLRRGNLQPAVAHYVYHKTLTNFVTTFLGKVRQSFSDFNQETGLDDLIDDILMRKGVDYDDDEEGSDDDYDIDDDDDVMGDSDVMCEDDVGDADLENQKDDNCEDDKDEDDFMDGDDVDDNVKDKTDNNEDTINDNVDGDERDEDNVGDNEQDENDASNNDVANQEDINEVESEEEKVEVDL